MDRTGVILGMCVEGEAQVKHYKAAVEAAICRGAEAEAKFQRALKEAAEKRQEAAEKSQEEADKFDYAMTSRDEYKVKHQEALEKNRDLMREVHALEQRTEKAELRVEFTEAKFQALLGRCNTMAAQQVADAAARSALPSTPTAIRKRARTADCECYKGPLRKSPLAANEQMRYMNNPSRTF
jgi:hypothetical protein